MHRRIVIISLSALVILFSFPPPTAAETSTTTTVNDEQIIHIVQPGETLFRIGLRYGITWTKIVEANGLTSTTIYVGQRLIIPVSDSAGPVGPVTESDLPPPTHTVPPPTPVPTPPPTPEPTTAPTATSEPVSADPEPDEAPAEQVYIVQPGDILSLIAQRHNTTVLALVTLNALPSANLIYPGQVLWLPESSPLDPALPEPPAVETLEKKILVDISEQHMYVYENGELIWSFVISTGMAGSPTAPGVYHVQSKIPNAWGSSWSIWMPNWLGIYWVGSLENGIHALPILPNGNYLWDGYLGTPISYGCVVMGLEDSALLYEWAEIGTEVEIVR